MALESPVIDIDGDVRPAGSLRRHFPLTLRRLVDTFSQGADMAYSAQAECRQEVPGIRCSLRRAMSREELLRVNDRLATFALNLSGPRINRHLESVAEALRTSDNHPLQASLTVLADELLSLSGLSEQEVA